MSPGAIPLAIAGLLAVAVHTCFVLAASLGHVEWCLPYVQGCTSISRASREAPEIYVYRALITSAGALLPVFWWLAAGWLRELDAQSPRPRLLVWLGVFGAACLIANAAILGETETGAKAVRRYFVIGFFAATYVAQCLLTAGLAARTRGRDPSHLTAVRRVMLAVIWCQLALAVINFGVFPVTTTFEVLESRMENAIEWYWVLLMCIFFWAVWLGWRRDGWTAARPVTGA